jgi:L-lactate dehydrogenase complex protein LldE
MLTCLCDAFAGEVGIATVRVLESFGFQVEFPENQTCCGQPPFNAGDWERARDVAAHARRVFHLDSHDSPPVVTPSSSCAAMMRHGYEMLWPVWKGARAYELCEFLVRNVSPIRWPGKPRPRKVAFHQACHGRMIGLGDTQVRVLSTLPGIELVPIPDAEQCCGFGGSFSATHGSTSYGIGQEKLQRALETGCEELVSGDMGCLQHLQRQIESQGLPLRTIHLAQLMAEAVPE